MTRVLHDQARRTLQGSGRRPGNQVRSILLLCDGGGSNNASHYLFKEDLQRLVDRLEIEIRGAHYPPYCSKYNPIEHRLFPHVTRACQGVIFESVGLVKELMEKTRTNTGLRVTVDILDKMYQTGRKYAEGFKENMKIMFDEILPKWNYRAVPSGS
jgi:Rhodopirellula transposase DDE domain